jgi:predicted aspartyl protease
LIDTGFSGWALLDAKVAKELKCHLTTDTQPVRLADGSVVESSHVVENTIMTVGTVHHEATTLRVFPLHSYDMILGKAWLDARDAAIICATNELHLDYSTLPVIVHGHEACHIDGSSLSNVFTHGLSTCNQFTKFVRQNDDLELMAAFLKDGNDDELLNVAFTHDIPKAQHLFNVENTIDVLRAKLDHVETATRDKFLSMLQNYTDSVFADQEYCSVEAALSRDVEHEINEIPHQPHPCGGIYRLSPPMLDELRRQLKALLAGGLIRPSMSPYGAPVLFARKKGGDWRMCIDYRALNKITIKDKFPLPRAEDLFDQLKGAKYFSKLDLKWGYHQIKMRAEDINKTAFRSQKGSYEWLCMPFGLQNAPATFQRFVQGLFQHVLGIYVCVYMDDILVFSKTQEEHVEHVRCVLDILKENKLLAKMSKCEFFAKEVEYLGHVVSEHGVSVDPAKVKAIRDWPELRTKTEVRSFLGLANYYRRFIQNFSALTAPLSALVHDDAPDPILWTPTHSALFAEIKNKLTHAPVLRTFDPDLRCMVVTDASSSHEAIGAVLMQDDGNGPRPIEFFSRKMAGAETRYPTREQELLAIKEALKHWRHYLLGVSFDIYSDHESLKYLQTQKDLSGKLLRWLDFIQMFDFGDIKYLPGKKNPVGDALSRPPIRTLATLQIACADLGQASSLSALPPRINHILCSLSLCDLEICVPSTTLHTRIQQEIAACPYVGPILDTIKSPKFNPETHKYLNKFI